MGILMASVGMMSEMRMGIKGEGFGNCRIGSSQVYINLTRIDLHYVQDIPILQL